MSRTRKILIVVGIIFSVAILLPIFRHYQLRFAVEAYIAELKAKGEPMELAQVIPPPVPPEQNGVPFIFNSLTNLEARYQSIAQTNPPTAMCEVLPGKAMVRWQQPAIIGFNENTWPLTNNLVTNTWEELGNELANVKDDLDRFQSLTNHPVLNFKLDYQQGLSIRLAHLAPLRRAAQWISAAAVYDLYERKTAKACAEVHTILAIVKGQAEERLEISQQVRDAIASIGAQTTWEILQDPNVSESDLASLQQDWESVEFVDAAKRAFLAERVINLHSMEHFLQNPSDLWRSVNGNDEEISRRLCKHLWQWFWAYADEKRMMQTYQVLADAMRMTETNRSFQSAQMFARTNFNRLGFEESFPQEGTMRIDIDPIGVRWLLSEGAFDSFRLLKRAMVFETARNMTIVAIALKRYELQHHELPPALDSLTPAILKTIPLDYMGGQALHYQKNSDGTFLLYSVGENGADDGGKPSIHKWWEFYWFAQTLDLVWPQPATPEEIQAYYDKQAKESK
jgi:hypothetical protein